MRQTFRRYLTWEEAKDEQWRASKCLLFVALLISVLLTTTSVVVAADKGKIISVKTNQSTFRPGDSIRVWVTVRSNENGQRRHLVVLNILNKQGKAVYDSHLVSEDIDFLISKNEVKSIGPFSFTWPSNLPRGTYSLFIGYRVHPWEPLIEFQGDKWHPPIRTVSLK